MNPKSTDRHPDLFQLSPAQNCALEVLDGRGTNAEAAEKAGVAPGILAEWAAHHPAYIAALNRREQEDWMEDARRCKLLTRKALENVTKAIERGEVGPSFQWLRSGGLDVLGRAPSGPTDATSVIEERRRRLPGELEVLAAPNATTAEAVDDFANHMSPEARSLAGDARDGDQESRP